MVRGQGFTLRAFLRRLGMAVVAVAVFTFPNHASTIVNATFHGAFYDVSFGATAAIPMGTLYTATLQYDASTTGPVNFTPSPGDYFEAQLGAYTVQGTPTLYQVLPGGQNFLVESTLLPGSIPGLSDPVTMTLDIDLCCAFYFDPNHLPTSFVGLPFPDRFFTILGSGTAQRAIADVSDINATIVPEPGSLVLGLGALIIVAIVIGRDRWLDQSESVLAGSPSGSYT